MGRSPGGGGGNEGAGVDEPGGNDAGKRRHQPGVLQQCARARQPGLGHFPGAAQVVHGLRHDEVGGLLASLGQAQVSGMGHLGLDPVLDFIREQLGHLNFPQQLPAFHGVAFVHQQGLQVPGNLGVEQGLLPGQDAERGERGTAGNFAALGQHRLHRRRGIGSAQARRSENRGEQECGENEVTSHK